MDDSTSFVTVRRYFKRHSYRDPVTKEPVEVKVFLDWGLGVVDGFEEGYVIAGAPTQLFSVNVRGFSVADPRILEIEEEVPLSQMPGPARLEVAGAVGGGSSAGAVHSKHPLI